MLAWVFFSSTVQIFAKYVDRAWQFPLDARNDASPQGGGPSSVLDITDLNTYSNYAGQTNRDARDQSPCWDENTEVVIKYGLDS